MQRGELILSSKKMLVRNIGSKKFTKPVEPFTFQGQDILLDASLRDQFSTRSNPLCMSDGKMSHTTSRRISDGTTFCENEGVSYYEIVDEIVNYYTDELEDAFKSTYHTLRWKKELRNRLIKYVEKL